MKDAAPDATRDGGNDPTCPATFGAPPGNCDVGLLCTYPEGTCTCRDYCGGAPPPPNEDLSHWSCTPKRTDGCPEEKPVVGTSCAGYPASCSYGDCCIETYLCGNPKKWSSGGIICPP